MSTSKAQNISAYVSTPSPSSIPPSRSSPSSLLVSPQQPLTRALQPRQRQAIILTAGRDLGTPVVDAFKQAAEQMDAAFVLAKIPSGRSIVPSGPTKDLHRLYIIPKALPQGEWPYGKVWQPTWQVLKAAGGEWNTFSVKASAAHAVRRRFFSLSLSFR